MSRNLPLLTITQLPHNMAIRETEFALKYDDADWHTGGNFPTDLSPSAAATHIGMFVGWAVLNGLAGDMHTVDFGAELETLKSRAITPGAWLLDACDAKFTDEDLNCDGNKFALAYYGNENNLHTRAGSFLADYANTFPDAETLYHIPDSWETFDAIAPVVRSRFDAWRKPSVKKMLLSPLLKL